MKISRFVLCVFALIVNMEPEVNKNELGENVEADRTLASVVRVLGVLPIKDADRIELAQVSCSRVG